MADRLNRWLLASRMLSALTCLLHLAVLASGAGSIIPPLLNLVLAAVSGAGSLYAFSGAGLIGRLPYLRTGLVFVSGFHLLQGLALILSVILGPSSAVMVVRSLAVIACGVACAFGTFRQWPWLSHARRNPLVVELLNMKW